MADLGWEDDDVTWGGIEITTKDFAPVYLSADEFFILGYGSETALDSFLERRGIIHEPGNIVLGQRVWPQITGPTGFTVQVKLGAHDTPDGAIDWEGPYDFTIDTDECLDFAVSGRFLAVRFESTGVPAWKLQGYDIDYKVIGRH